MNEDELKIVKKKELVRKKIEKIESLTLKDQLLTHFDLECQLDVHFKLLPTQVINSLNLFEKKLEFYHQLEKDLSNKLTSPGNEFLLSEKLDILRLKLGSLYVIGEENEIKRKNYNEIKDFILKILNLNINLTLKCFNLIIKLLDKVTDLELNKEFVTNFNLLKLFIEKNHLPNEENLRYIYNLGREINEADIRKCFYGIIYELDKKLLFQALLNNLLETLKNHNNSILKFRENSRNSPLVDFTVKLITHCINDVEMEATDLYQLVNLLSEILERDNERIKNKTFLERINNPENLIDLKKFKENLKETISLKIIDDLKSHSSHEKDSYSVASILEGFDFAVYFPISVNNKKLMFKLSETKFHCSKELEKKITSHDPSTFKRFKEGFIKISSKANEIMENARALASDAKESLEEIVEISAGRVTEFLKKKSEIPSLEDNEKMGQANIKTSITQAKTQLLTIKEKLQIWNSILAINCDKNHENISNQIDISQVDLKKCLEVLQVYNNSINGKFAELIQQITDDLEKIVNAIKEKRLWFSISEIKKISLFHKVFRRGYFSYNFTLNKIKIYLNNDLSFNRVNSLILNQTFWSLLGYGIVRWPWMNKVFFAKTWTEQLCLPNAIIQIEKLRNTLLVDEDKEKILKELMNISKFFSPDQNEVFLILINLKK